MSDISKYWIIFIKVAIGIAKLEEFKVLPELFPQTNMKEIVPHKYKND